MDNALLGRYYVGVIHMSVILIVLFLSTGANLGGSSSSVRERSIRQVGSGWQRLRPKDEEFSALTPAEPSVLIQSSDFSFSAGGERVLERRSYSAYADGFTFVVKSYKASRPHRLLKDMDHIFSQLKLLGDVKKNGFAGKGYQTLREGYVGFVFYFVTAKHVYIVTVASRDPNHPSIARFVSHFSPGDDVSLPGDVLPRKEDALFSPGDAPKNFITSKEATVKPVVVWKPEPGYTGSGQYWRRTGTVVLRAIFTASGQVIITEVVKGVKDGLTEKAIEAAKHIRFFPAEKDGQPVSQVMQLEYDFRLY